MENQKFYVPILKWKRGEQKSLEHITLLSKSKIFPLIEIPPIEYDWINNVPKKTLDNHIANFCNQVNDCWGTNRIFVDLLWIEDEGLLANGMHPIIDIINKSKLLNLNLVPVLGLSRSQQYTQAILDLIQNQSIHEICIRIEPNDFNNVNQSLSTLLNTLGLQNNQCHIIIDLKEISTNNLPIYQMMIPIIINNLPNLSSFLGITLSGTAFPDTLSLVSSNSHKLLPRTEFTLWQTIISSNNLSIDLQFGDYCIANPNLLDVDPRFMNMSGNIRYTIDNNFLIYKGINTRRNGFGQMQDLCSKLVNSQYYCQPQFSWGDNYINDCANGTASTGNAETWRRVGTNHHLEFIVNQLSNLSYF